MQTLRVLFRLLFLLSASVILLVQVNKRLRLGAKKLAPSLSVVEEKESDGDLDSNLLPWSCDSGRSWNAYCQNAHIERDRGLFVLTRRHKKSNSIFNFCFLRSDGIDEAQAASIVDNYFTFPDKKTRSVVQFSPGRVGSKILLWTLKRSFASQAGVSFRHSHRRGPSGMKLLRSNPNSKAMYLFGDPLDIVGSLDAFMRKGQPGWVVQHAKHMGSFPGNDINVPFLASRWRIINQKDVLRLAEHFESHLWNSNTTSRTVSFTLRSETYRHGANVAALAFWMGLSDASSIRFPEKDADIVGRRSHIPRCKRYKLRIQGNDRLGAFAAYSRLGCALVRLPDHCFWL